jgi:hypothetical protein
VTLVVGLNILIYFYVGELSIAIGCSLLMNTVLLLTVGKYILRYVLFPYSNSIMKFHYSFSMNKKMVEDVQKSFKAGHDII